MLICEGVIYIEMISEAISNKFSSFASLDLASFPFQKKQKFATLDPIDSLEIEIHFGYIMRFILTS